MIILRLDHAPQNSVEAWQLLMQSQAELRHLEVLVRWADVILLVYSITDKASFHLAVQLLQQVIAEGTMR